MDTFIVINCLLNALLILISVTGNTVILAVILTTPSLRSPSTVFLCSLVVSDLLVGLVTQPVYIAQEIQTDPLLQVAARMLFNTGCGVSLSTMTTISLDRLLARHYHMRDPDLMTEKRAIYTSTTIWFVVIVISCLSLWHKSHVVLAVCIVICLVMSAFSYIKIYQIVRQHHSQIRSQQLAVQSSEHNLNMAQSEKKTINTFVYYICMMLCYYPMFISMLIYVIDRCLTSKFWTFANTLVFMNSSINPIVYCLRQRELRAAVSKKTLKKL